MVVKEFRNKYAFLSNFHICRRGIKVDGLTYRSVEHAYQASKTFNPDERETIYVLRTAGQAKKAGYRVTLREDWEAVKLPIMRQLVLTKFINNPDLAQQLRDTGDSELIEGNWWGDNFWGVDIHSGHGENHLGKILMEVRKCLSIMEEAVPQ